MGFFFVGDGFLADGFHKGSLDLALLEILEQPQGQGGFAGVLMDGGNKNIFKVFGGFHIKVPFKSIALYNNGLTKTSICILLMFIFV